MKKFLLVFLGFIVVMMSSCELLKNAVHDKVITTDKFILEDQKDNVKHIPLEDLSEGTRKYMEENFPGEKIVLADVDQVKPDAFKLTLDPGSSDFWGDVLAFAGKVGGSFWPPLVALEGLGALFFRRKRDHYLSAIRAALPTDGKVDLADAVMSVGKALGFGHSSKETKDVFEAKKVA